MQGSSNFGAYDTKSEVRFTNDVIPTLREMGVEVHGLREVRASDELHVDLILPTHERALRVEVLEIIDAFEESYTHTVTVAPALLYADDLAEA